MIISNYYKSGTMRKLMTSEDHFEIKNDGDLIIEGKCT